MWFQWKLNIYTVCIIILICFDVTGAPSSKETIVAALGDGRIFPRKGHKLSHCASAESWACRDSQLPGPAAYRGCVPLRGSACQPQNPLEGHVSQGLLVLTFMGLQVYLFCHWCQGAWCHENSSTQRTELPSVARSEDRKHWAKVTFFCRAEGVGLVILCDRCSSNLGVRTNLPSSHLS